MKSTPVRLVLITISCLFLLACSDSSSNGNRPSANPAILDFEAYTWSDTSPGGYWAPRAGLQTVELNGRFYLLGGRTPNPPQGPNPIPGDSVIWSDVWASDDQGVSWENILTSGVDTHWSPRAYFKAVTLDDYIYVLGGQDFEVRPSGCPPFLPPETCPPLVSFSQFFNDVWLSNNGTDWTRMTDAAGWDPRAGLSATVLNGEIYVLGGSVNDDTSIVGGPPLRVYFNDVWKSADGAQWQQLTDNAPWTKRAGAELVTKGDYLYLLGGEEGFLCDPLPTCELPYFNDVWRSKNGADWELVTPAAGWSARPGHQCGVVGGTFSCFGGFGLAENPVDVWTSEDGADWQLLTTPPWNARSGEDIKYDFDIIVIDDADAGSAIYTFGGDRETFDFDDPLNYLRVDADVWVFTNPNL